MTRPARPSWTPFRDLERTLLRRRFQQLELRLRIEIAAIALLIAAFCGWQARLPLDALARARGPGAVAAALAAGLVALAAAGGVAAGARHLRRLRAPAVTRDSGPAWLALPISPADLARHLAWESRLGALWAGVPAAAGLAAAAGFLPAPLLVLLAGAFAALLWGASGLGCQVAFRLAARLPGTEASPGAHPLERLLTASPAEPRGASGAPARWRRAAPWRALWAKDLLLSLRRTAARERARSTLLLMALAALVWRLPVDPRLARLVAFGVALLAAAALAGWLVELAGADPFSTLRALPLGARPVWAARAAWAGLGALLLAALQVLAVPALSPPALSVFLVWITAGTLLIGILGAQLGVTLYPRADHAQRVLGMTLAIAIAASLMIPLLGWVLLLAAAIHSARRLPRWATSEEG